MTIGIMVNKFLDAILPDAAGDAVGAIIDGAMLNWAGLAVNAVDLAEDGLELAGADVAADVFGLLAEVGGMFAGGENQVAEVGASALADVLGPVTGSITGNASAAASAPAADSASGFADFVAQLARGLNV